MADVSIRICDRCKKQIEARRGVAIYEPIFVQSIIRLDLFRKSTWLDDRFKKMTMDLCEECSNKLVWFLEGAELAMGEDSSGEATDDEKWASMDHVK